MRKVAIWMAVAVIVIGVVAGLTRPVSQEQRLFEEWQRSVPELVFTIEPADGSTAASIVADDGETPETSIAAAATPTTAVATAQPPPANAVALAAGDVGVRALADGGARGTMRAVGVGCEGDAILQIQTDEGVFLLRVPVFPGWNCGTVLQQWRGMAPRDGSIGLRASGGAEVAESVTLVDGDGKSMVIRVEGVWRGG